MTYYRRPDLGHEFARGLLAKLISGLNRTSLDAEMRIKAESLARLLPSSYGIRARNNTMQLNPVFNPRLGRIWPLASVKRRG